jgi:bifunctional non-homologous end joining protein LigD
MIYSLALSGESRIKHVSSGRGRIGGVPAERVKVEVDGRTLTLTNLDRVIYSSGVTKAEVVDYYLGVADVLLPHLTDRPLTLVRYPEGVAAGGFFVKNAPAGTPGWVRTSRQTTSDGTIEHVVVDSRATLVWLANLSALELHIPLWKVEPLPRAGPDDRSGDQQERADCDRLVIDLDPGRGTSIAECATLAMALRQALADDGLTAVPKTTGGAGMHLMVPIAPAPVDEVVGYVRGLAEALAAAAPDLATSKIGEVNRSGRVLLDWRQNVYRATTVAPYSLRAGPDPTVSTPVSWDEVAAASAGMELQFGPDAVRKRIAAHGDLAADVLTTDRPALPG